jgi:hypothetical protein
VQRSVALGVSILQREFRLAVRVQRPGLMNGPLVEAIRQRAAGEVEVRMIGRLDKRAPRTVGKRRRVSRRVVPVRPAQAVPWFQSDTRPLLIGASIGHVDVTAGTIGGFVTHKTKTCILSNNHVLANENSAQSGDAVLQRGRFDGGRAPAERVAELESFVGLRTTGANLVDAAVAEVEDGVDFDRTLLRDLLNPGNGKLSGLGPATLDEGTRVRKVGRTTGPTAGRVTAFALDNVVVNYDIGNLRFDDQVEIEGEAALPFSDGGDSGSLIVNESQAAVALLFAGGETGGSNGMGLTYANPLKAVLDELDATLLF